MSKLFNAGVVFCLCVGVFGIEGGSAAPRPPAEDALSRSVTPRVKGQDEDPELFQAVNDSLDLRTTSVQTLGFVNRTESSLTTAVVVNGKTWTLDLQQHSVRSPDFEVWVQDDSGRLTLVVPPAEQTYLGTVLELPGSEVRASYTDHGIDAVVYTTDGTYGIQALRGGGVAAAQGDHAVYDNDDWLNRRNYSCAADVGQHVFDGMADLKSAPENVPHGATAAYRVAQIALDADFEFFQLNGSDVNATILDMENVINGLQAIYESQLNITYEISSVIVRTSDTDPYSSTNPSTLLGQQVSHWNASPQSSIQRDVHHLFTGKNLDGSVIGIAYIGAVCNQGWAYGLSQSRFTVNMPARVALTAHELGHNWNAQHCNGCTSCTDCCQIMCSGLGGCSGILTGFGCQEVSQMSAFRDTRTCLSSSPGGCTTNGDCNDSNPCTSDSCNAGSCVNANVANGTACSDDGNTCTTDTCTNGVCQHSPNTNLCSDGNACTSNDRCTAGACTGTPLTCNDNNPCTNDTCNAGVCQFVNNTNTCNDGNDCTTNDRCALGVCAGTAMTCNDNNPCTNDSCTAGVCQYVNNTNTCNDGSTCTSNDRCTNGVCTGTGMTCNDNNPCTTDTCNAGVCQFVNNTNTCNDGNACTSNDRCAAGVCAGTGLTCNDNNPCTNDTCNAGVCQYVNNTNTCNDGNTCTSNDRCTNGVCTGTGMTCNDNNPCTTDSCSAGVCQYVNNTNSCNDGNACTSNDRCTNGVCLGTGLTCNDNNPCTNDTCNAGVCQFVNNTNTCNDGNACTSNDRCTAGVCAGTGMVCNDNNPCTNDSCSAGACQFVNNTNICNDGNACTSNDRCSLGVCTGTGMTCNDNNPCTNDSCNAGVCQYVNNTNTCNDGNSCTSNDRCAAGVCAGTGLTCNDNNPCTTDTCSTGICLYVINTNTCDDGDACTVNDRCLAGLCSGTMNFCDDGNACTFDWCDEGCRHADNGLCTGCDFDGVCDLNEGPCNCPEDCGQREFLCGDGLDDDCDDLIDCWDPDCNSAPECACQLRFEKCSTGADCCSGVCSRYNRCR